MRKEVLGAVALGLVLVAVIFTQRQLRDFSQDPSTEEVPFAEEGVSDSEDAPDTIEEIPTETITESTAEPGAANPADTEPGELNPSQPIPESVQKSLKMAQEAFRQKQAITQSEPADVHHTPKQTLDAAQQLGAILELEAQYPTYIETFRHFYLECAGDENAITVIRAQCLEKYIQRAALDDQSKEKLLSEFPEAVVRLYRAL